MQSALHLSCTVSRLEGLDVLAPQVVRVTRLPHEQV
jgi:hypothetical protein